MKVLNLAFQLLLWTSKQINDVSFIKQAFATLISKVFVKAVFQFSAQNTN